MSFDLGFFSNPGNVKSIDLKKAWEQSSNKELDWPSTADFSQFVDSLHKKLADFDSAMIINHGSAEQGHLFISLQGPHWQDAHHEIGGLLMMHNVICYDPQSGQATIELEAI